TNSLRYSRSRFARLSLSPRPSTSISMDAARSRDFGRALRIRCGEILVVSIWRILRSRKESRAGGGLETTRPPIAKWTRLKRDRDCAPPVRRLEVRDLAAAAGAPSAFL